MGSCRNWRKLFKTMIKLAVTSEVSYVSSSPSSTVLYRLLQKGLLWGFSIPRPQTWVEGARITAFAPDDMLLATTTQSSSNL